MALRNWWHLSNNANDYGLDRVNGVISNVTFDGYSALFDNDNDRIQVDYENLFIEDYNSEYTMACWVYLNSTATNHSSSLFSRGDWNSGSEQTCFALYDFNNGYGKILVPNKSGWNNGISLSNKIQLKQWYHIAITYNGTKTIGYVNGVYVGEYAGGGFPSSTGIHYAYIGAATYYSGFTLKGKIRDFRLYDHCLSKKEVKELSKGLILHYDFEDEEIEKTTNMVTSAYYSSGNQTWGGHTSVTENVTFSDAPISRGSHITVTYSGSDGGGLSRSISHNTLAPNTQYTYSMYIKSSDNLAYTHANFMYRYEHNSGGTKLYEGGLYNASRRIYCGNGWYRIWGTFTTNANTASTALYFFTYPNKNVEYWIGGCQVEAKDHMTPYVLGSRSDSKVYDNSGYNNNGDCSSSTETPVIYTDGPSGMHYMNLPLNGFVRCNNHNFDKSDNFTYSTWIRHHGRNGTTTAYAFTNGRADGTHWGWGVGINDSGYHIHYGDSSKTITVAANEWHLLTVTISGNTQTIYLDGIQNTSGTCTTLPTYEESVGLGLGSFCYSNNPKLYPSNCDFADFKIFATTLSADDVKAEYNRKAAIDRDGNLFTGEIIEGNASSVKVDKSNFVAGNNIVEGTDKVKFADKYTQLEYLEFSRDSNRCCIDSGVTMQRGYTIEMSVMLTNTSSDNQFLFSDRSSSGGYFHVYINPSRYATYQTPNIGTITMTLNQKYTFTKNGTKCYVDDVYYGESGTASQTTRTLLIGGVDAADGSRGFYGRCYYFQILDGAGNLIRHFIPAKRNSDNVLGMYDLAERKFYTNAGSGTFTAGPTIGSISAIYANQIIEN